MINPDAPTIHAALAGQAAQRGDRTFLFFEDSRFTCREIDDASSRVAKGLQDLGLVKGDRVAIMMGNRPEFLFLWFGLSKLGAIEVPINTAHKGEVLRHMLATAECRLMVCEADLLDHVAPLAGELPALERLIVLDGPPESPAPSLPAIAYGDLIANDGAFEPVNVGPADAFAIMFTSGTTGPSKGALLPQNYPLAMARMICRMVEYDESDRLYNALPLFHGNAQFLSTLPALISGAQMVLARRFSASAFWADVRAYGCTEFNYIGGIIPILLKAEPRPDDRDNPIRVMLGAGAPADRFEEFEQRFDLRLVESYGMSEIGIPLGSTPDDRKPGSCGRPLPEYEVMLVDDQGDEVGVDVPGELLIRPRHFCSMMLEYYRMPEKTVEAWRDLWFHTGDYLRRDEDGYFFFIDRKKDALRRRGENISSYEVEKIINAHPAVLESAAIAVKSELGEDEVMVCVALKAGQALTPEALVRYCEAHMARFMVPRFIRFMEALPKTPTERIRKYRLREDGITDDTFDRESGPS